MPTIGTDPLLADRIFDLLKREIISSRQKPGQPFNETVMAKRFKASRTPIREACGRLSKEGLLVSIPNKGYLVAPITIKDVLDIYQLRHIVEPLCAETAAIELDGNNLAELEDIVRVENGRQGNSYTVALIEMNHDFHGRLAQTTKNDRIVDLVDSLLLACARLDYMLMDLYPTKWIDHSEILSSLKAHDRGAARQAMSRHIQLTQEQMSKIFSGEGLSLPNTPQKEEPPRVTALSEN